MAERERLRLAMVIPPFSRGSGGHNTLFQIFTRLERRGHACSVWMADFHGYTRSIGPGVLRSEIREYFAALEGPVYKGFERVAGSRRGDRDGLADGAHDARARWNQGAGLPRQRPRARVLRRVGRAGTERETYTYGMHCIAASPWLRDRLTERYETTAEAFELGVDHDTYRPRPVERRRDTVIYYARYSTPRRAVPIGLMALAELKRRRPDERIVLFGTAKVLDASFDYEHVSVLNTEQLRGSTPKRPWGCACR